ncbi:MAG: glycoside hydrolase family 127 protein, partial [bacterium]
FTSPNVFGKRTWDVWVHSYMMLGLLEVNRYWPNEKYLNACRKAGDLLVSTFSKGDKSLAMLGNHQGLSSTIVLESMVKLYFATGDSRYLDFAKHIIQQMEAREGLQVVSRSLKGYDLSQIGTGKIYQLCWNFVGLVRLFEATGMRDYHKAAENAWQNICDFHLTPAGGPWGGIAGHKEVFNDKEFFSPYAMTETCSIMSWIHLNRELLRFSGDARYADEIEKTIYNAILGAQDPNGEDWCYFTFPNGRRNNTYYWACCKSSGAIALEEIGPLIFGKMQNGVAVNLYSESAATTTLPSAGATKITQKTNYPKDGEIKLIIEPAKAAAFPLFLRVPQWAEEAAIHINGKTFNEPITPGAYVKLMREWKRGDEVVLNLPMKLRVHPKTYSVDHHGQEVVRMDYFAVTRGPLVYAAGLIDGFKREDTFKLPKLNPETQFTPAPVPPGFNGPAFHMMIPGRQPIL